MFLGVASLSMAVSPQQPSVYFSTEVRGTGTISVDQYSNSCVDVMFETKVRMRQGTLNFDQDIVRGRDRFSNDVRMNGRGIKFDNMAGKHQRVIHFEQRLSIDESSANWDELKSKQVFSRGTPNGRKYIAQEFQVNPTANPGQECEPDKCKKLVQDGYFFMGRYDPEAMLHQKGKATGDYIMGRQWSNIGGFSQSKVEQYNQADYTTIEQMLMFSSGLMP